jgi:hypothetical protein
MIIDPKTNPSLLENVKKVVEKLGLKYQIFYVDDEEKAKKLQEEQLPPPDTIYIYVIQS